MTFTLPPLPYAYDALGPHMSKETLEFHHDKHHQAYVTNGNNAIKGTEFEGKSLEEIVKGSYDKNAAVFNNAGQHYNHIHFWKWMKPNGGGSKLPGRLEKKINEDLGGLEKFKTDFAAAGVGQFGSGWCWLQVKNGKLEISKTPNGENPLVHGASPILGCDVWEHSYYIDYRNRRPDYLKAFVDHLVNWDYVDELFGKAAELLTVIRDGRRPDPESRGIRRCAFCAPPCRIQAAAAKVAALRSSNRAWVPLARAWVRPHFRLLRNGAALKQDGSSHPAPDPSPLSNLPLKDPAPAEESADAEPRPRRTRKPIGWSMITIAVLVAISATLVWRRDGFGGVLEILTHDLALFGGILPRVLRRLPARRVRRGDPAA